MRRLIALAFLVSAACGGPTQLASDRIVATPEPGRTASAAVVTPSPAPTIAAAPQTPTPAPTPTPPTRSLEAFRGLGSWIDVFDHNDDPASILPLVREMAARGVRTLYLETARYASTTDIQFPRALGAALDEAKGRGLHVVAWYPPAFDDLERDVRRSLAAVRFVSPKGNRFDAFGADIEYGEKVPDHALRTQAAVDYSRRLRAGAPNFPLAAIVISPTSLEIKEDRWPGYPWAEVGRRYDVVMPMNYWTTRGHDAATATQLTERNVAECKRLTGLPVHVIGGLGEDADEAQVSAYVAAAKRSGSLGGALYDYTTTRENVWDELRGLNS